MLFESYVRLHIFSSVRVTGWPPIWDKIELLDLSKSVKTLNVKRWAILYNFG